MHERTVSVTGNHRIDVTDVAYGREPHVVFVLPPGAAVAIDGARAIVEAGTTRASFGADGIAGWRAEPGEYAPRFGVTVPVVRLVGPVSGDRCHTTIGFGPR
jgi:hypothetical protein